MKIVDDEEYEKRDNFFIELGPPRWLKRGISGRGRGDGGGRGGRGGDMGGRGGDTQPLTTSCPLCSPSAEPR